MELFFSSIFHPLVEFMDMELRIQKIDYKLNKDLWRGICGGLGTSTPHCLRVNFIFYFYLFFCAPVYN